MLFLKQSEEDYFLFFTNFCYGLVLFLLTFLYLYFKKDTKLKY